MLNPKPNKPKMAITATAYGLKHDTERYSDRERERARQKKGHKYKFVTQIQKSDTK